MAYNQFKYNGMLYNGAIGINYSVEVNNYAKKSKVYADRNYSKIRKVVFYAKKNLFELNILVKLTREVIFYAKKKASSTAKSFKKLREVVFYAKKSLMKTYGFIKSLPDIIKTQVRGSVKDEVKIERGLEEYPEECK